MWEIRVLGVGWLVLAMCAHAWGLKRKIKTARCKYTFVVNELDSASCPQTVQADRHSEVSLRENPLVPLRAPKGVTANESGEVKEWLSNMEKQLSDELQKSNDINSTLARHETSLTKAEQLLAEYQSNFTAIFRMLRYLEMSIKDQGEISQNLDKKLSGVMLDVVEVNSVLSKKVVTVDGEIHTKNIEVQAVSQVTGCSRAPDAITFKGKALVAGFLILINNEII